MVPVLHTSHSRFQFMLAVSGICVLLAFAFLIQLICWQNQLRVNRRIMTSPVPVRPQPSRTVQPPVLSGHALTLQSLPSMGDATLIHASTVKREWPDDSALLKEAFRRFSAASRLEESLFLAVKLPLEDLPQEQRFVLVSEYYKKNFFAVCDAELQRYRTQTARTDLSPALMPLPYALTFCENVRTALLDAGVPDDIARILIRAYAVSFPHDWMRNFMLSRLKFPASARMRSYASSEAFFSEQLQTDPLAVSAYFSFCFARLRSRLALPDDLLWLNRVPASREQIRALTPYLRFARQNNLELDAFRRFPAAVRWAVVQIAASDFPSGLPGLLQVLSPSFSSRMWMDVLKESSDDSAQVRQWLRLSPGVAEALTCPDYSAAFDLMRIQYRKIALAEIPPEMSALLRKTLLLEETRWKQLVNEKLWEHARTHTIEWTPDRKVRRMESVFFAVQESFPVNGERREDTLFQQKILMALVRLNRGADRRYIHINVELNINDLRQFFAQEDLPYE